MTDERFLKLEERVNMLELKVQLLSENSNISSLLFEYNINKSQYVEMMNLMDEIREAIDSGREVSNSIFQQKSI